MVGSPPLLQLEKGPGGVETVSAALISLLNLFQQEIVRKINGAITFGNGDHATQTGNIKGQWIELITPSTPGQEFSVPHDAGKVPAGVMKLRSDKAAHVYDSNIGGWTDTIIYLKCDVSSVTIRIALI